MSSTLTSEKCTLDPHASEIPPCLLKMLEVRQWKVHTITSRYCTYLRGAICATFTDRVAIWYDRPIRKDNTKRLLNEIEMVPPKISILIVVLRISQQAMLNIRSTSERHVEFCLLSTFAINPMQSSLVPEFRILTIEDETTYLTRRKITRNQLPFILRSDPISAYLGALPGNIMCDRIAGIARTVIND
jgi:DNA-directed RNA polymerase subunit H (RpoH/RPB5)